MPGPQTQAYESQADIIGYGGAAGGGKALSLDTRIPTIDGWTTMGEIEVGDVVFDERGIPCTVVGATEIMLDRPVYAVRFDDGSEILADAEHQWLTSTVAEREALMRRDDGWRARRRANRPPRGIGKRPDLAERNAARAAVAVLPELPRNGIRTTSEIAASLMDDSHTNHAVSVAQPLELPEVELPIPPYTLGAWLGDGTSQSGGFTTADQEVLDAIRADGFEIRQSPYHAGGYQYTILGLRPRLRLAGVLGDKHIPVAYQRASFAQRLALLQGMVDTDGHVTERGAVEITLTNERLMRDVWRLLMTLGIRATVTEGRATLDGRDCGAKYRVKFMTVLTMARLQRKADRLKLPTRGVHLTRFITSVVSVASVPVRCIQVDSPSHLYLASEALIPTHNSMLAIGKAVTQHKKSIIFRRHKEDVKDLWSKLRAVCGSVGRPNESAKSWQDLPGDRSVRLVGLQHEWDWMKFQGNEHDFWDFDEAPQFPETAIRTLMAWCRSPDPNQRCQVMLGFNPPTTPEGQWVVDFFAPWLDGKHPDPAEPGELRWFARIDDKDVECDGPTPFEHKGELIRPLSRTFFPARLADNPLLDATNYRAQLQGLPEPLRSQMLYGDFSVGLTDGSFQVIPSAWVRAAQARWVAGGRPETVDGRAWPLSAIGVDVAQGGSARTVLARRYGDWFAPLQIIPGVQTPEPEDAAAFVIAALAEAGGPALVDSDGVGAGCYGIVRAQLPKRVRAYRGSAQTAWTDSSGQLEYANVRAAAWWAFREMLDPNSGREIAIPPGRDLLAELTAPTWKLTAGKIQLEKKEDIIKRLGRSPDIADAIVQACWPAGAAWDVSQPLAMAGRAG